MKKLFPAFSVTRIYNLTQATASDMDEMPRILLETHREPATTMQTSTTKYMKFSWVLI